MISVSVYSLASVASIKNPLHPSQGRRGLRGTTLIASTRSTSTPLNGCTGLTRCGLFARPCHAERSEASLIQLVEILQCFAPHALFDAIRLGHAGRSDTCHVFTHRARPERKTPINVISVNLRPHSDHTGEFDLSRSANACEARTHALRSLADDLLLRLDAPIA
jgi:hypothetical protein